MTNTDFDRTQTDKGRDRGWCPRFLRDTQGSLSLYGLAASLVMMIFCGIGVDMMYAELKRIKLQQTLDRAVVAAASLENPIDAKTVVEAYFAAAGMEALDLEVSITQGPGQKSVHATTRSTMPSNFLSLIGVDTLQAQAAATAEHRAGAVEISVVLDVSSSMYGNNRLGNLKSAMDAFIAEVVPPAGTPTAGVASINIVPYSLTVNPGPMAQFYSIDDKHDLGNCVWFENSHFDTLGIDQNTQMERYSHFADGSSGYTAQGTVDLPMCPSMPITPMQTDQDSLFSAVDALRGWDGTGIDIGAKWGLHMLDPSFRPVVTSMIAAGDLPAHLAGRPVAYDAQGARKIMILMSDGENDSQRDLRENLRDGLAPIWQDNLTGHYSVLVQDARGTAGFDPLNDTNSMWYWERTDGFDPFPDSPQHAGQNGNGNAPQPRTDWDNVAANMTQLTWPEVFNVVRHNHLFPRFFQTPAAMGYLTAEETNDYQNPIDWSRISNADTNQRLSDICALARSKGVEVYTIAFEPPSDLARTTLSDCASSPAHFFEAQGIDIKAAFGGIATQLTKLRLTQ